MNMGSHIAIDNPGLVSKESLLQYILPKYQVNVNRLGIRSPRCKGAVQQYRWWFTLDKPLNAVVEYFSEEKIMTIFTEIGKPSLKQFELQKDEKLDVGAKGLYRIKKPFTIARGEFVITHKGLENRVLRIGYIRLENLRKNWRFLGMMDMSYFGFSIFEFDQIEDGKTKGSYYIAQQLPGHKWGMFMAEVLKKKLGNHSFYMAFVKLKKQIESCPSCGGKIERILF